MTIVPILLKLRDKQGSGLPEVTLQASGGAFGYICPSALLRPGHLS